MGLLKNRWCAAIVLGAASWCVTAAAQPRHDDHRDDREHREVRDDRHPDAHDMHPGAATPPAHGAAMVHAPPADPALAGRIRMMEQQRQQARRTAVKDEKAWAAQREPR